MAEQLSGVQGGAGGSMAQTTTAQTFGAPPGTGSAAPLLRAYLSAVPVATSDDWENPNFCKIVEIEFGCKKEIFKIRTGMTLKERENVIDVIRRMRTVSTADFHIAFGATTGRESDGARSRPLPGGEVELRFTCLICGTQLRHKHSNARHHVLSQHLGVTFDRHDSRLQNDSLPSPSLEWRQTTTFKRLTINGHNIDVHPELPNALEGFVRLRLSNVKSQDSWRWLIANVFKKNGRDKMVYYCKRCTKHDTAYANIVMHVNSPAAHPSPFC
eukprot:Selendium_serpulae@DN1067_c0_g1_i1.p1